MDSPINLVSHLVPTRNDNVMVLLLLGQVLTVPWIARSSTGAQQAVVLGHAEGLVLLAGGRPFGYQLSAGRKLLSLIKSEF